MGKRCKACGTLIFDQATKCSNCGSFQDWRSKLNLSTTFLSLIVALISVIALTIPIVRNEFIEPNSEIRVNFALENFEIKSIIKVYSVEKGSNGIYYAMANPNLKYGDKGLLFHIKETRIINLVGDIVVSNLGERDGFLGELYLNKKRNFFQRDTTYLTNLNNDKSAIFKALEGISNPSDWGINYNLPKEKFFLDSIGKRIVKPNSFQTFNLSFVDTSFYTYEIESTLDSILYKISNLDNFFSKDPFDNDSENAKNRNLSRISAKEKLFITFGTIDYQSTKFVDTIYFSSPYSYNYNILPKVDYLKAVIIESDFEHYSNSRSPFTKINYDSLYLINENELLKDEIIRKLNSVFDGEYIFLPIRNIR